MKDASACTQVTSVQARLDEADQQLATEGLGSTWQIDEVAIKPLPACHFTHAVADAAIALHREHGFSADTLDSIKRVVAKVPRGTVEVVFFLASPL